MALQLRVFFGHGFLLALLQGNEVRGKGLWDLGRHHGGMPLTELFSLTLIHEMDPKTGREILN